MNSRKLTIQQQKRIAQQQKKHLSTTDDAKLTGRVIATYRRYSVVEDNAGHLWQCHRLKNTGNVVCGDYVIWQQAAGDSGNIIAVDERRTLLQRPDRNGKARVIAANIDQILIICAPLPEMNEGLIDRYLVAAEHAAITPLIVLNKVDMLNEARHADYMQRLNAYSQLGYQVLETSARLEHGLQSILTALLGKTSILAGQSGVGKSSLINSLLPGVALETGEVSEASGKGQHTTTTARLYHLPGQPGDIIDSPGVREFGLFRLSGSDVANGFIEFRDYLGSCRFRDCKHINEPGCAITRAVKEKKISRQRHESYQRILESL